MRCKAGIAAAAISTGLACVKPYDPFKIPAEELRQRIDTVAITSLAISVEFDDEQRVRAMIEPRVVSTLREGGFEVVPPEEWDRRWLAIAREIGPIWDPATGKRDDGRYQAARSALYHDLALERGVDAIVLLDLYLEKTEAALPSPNLCGVQRDVYWPVSLAPQIRVTLAYGACLQLSVLDMESRELYGIRHGLEFMDTYALQTHARRPLDQRLRDPALVEEALAALAGPLATRRK